MNASLLAVLNDTERLLVAETERAKLAALDEDAAIELETRIRRAQQVRGPVPPGGQRRCGRARRAGQGAPGEHNGPDEGRGVRGGPVPGERAGCDARPAGRAAAARGAAGRGPGREAEPWAQQGQPW